MHIQQNTFQPVISHTNFSCLNVAKAMLFTIAVIGGIAALIIGCLSHFRIIAGVNTITSELLMGLGTCIECTLIAWKIYECKKSQKEIFKEKSNLKDKRDFTEAFPIKNRKAKGFLKSPYSLGSTIRFLTNHITNGHFSIINPDRKNMQLLNHKGRIRVQEGSVYSYLKVVFLGDIMVSRSGKSPELDERMKRLLKSAQVIVANIEAPVVYTSDLTKRGISLKFKMGHQYLKSICACNRTAKWIFSIANNHACDTSDQSKEDVSGIYTTIESIKHALPGAEIIGAEIGEAKPVYSFLMANGAKIGFMAWTEVMNFDKKHFNKKILREDDISEEVIAHIKSEHHILIGFPHGNEEQSYYPLKETRDRWCQLMGQQAFDIIVGHGPHVIHPAECVNDRLLFHSIGNFCSPMGRSQTRVGCIPEIDFCFDKEGKLLNMRYRINLLEQRTEKIELLAEIDEKASIYPEIISRLQKIWAALFTIDSTQNFTF
jgi:hypothetical protein